MQPYHEEKEEGRRWVKDDTHFRRHRTSLETRPERFTGFLTPNKDFFVCNATQTVRDVDLATYRLQVKGDAVERPLSLGYDILLRLPSHTVLCYLECAGNMRQLYEDVMGEAIGDSWTHWQLGGVGMAAWTGVSLREVLTLAGIKPEAVAVNIKGLDEDAPEGGVSRPLPPAKALDSDTILAYAMNGEPLPPDHGFPLRAIVPGWVGTNSIKWVGSITVSSRPIWVERNTTMYVLKGEAWRDAVNERVQGGEITAQNIKSSLALPWKAHLSAGQQLVRGLARSPHAKIARVQWRTDDKNEWQTARLLPPILKYAWVRFEFEWEASPGSHVLMTRATDEAGHTQPLTQPFNEEGYLFNRVYSHPVQVST